MALSLAANRVNARLPLGIRNSRRSLTVRAVYRDRTDDEKKQDRETVRKASLSQASFPEDLRQDKVAEVEPQLEETQEQLRRTIDELQKRWEAVEDKKTAVALVVGAVVGTVLFSSVLSWFDRLPLVPDLLTFVGLLTTGNFFYRYILFRQGRAELRVQLKDLYANLRDRLDGNNNASP